MSSDYFPDSQAEAYERFEFEFPARPLAGRSIALAGGTGGLGAAAAALLAGEGAKLTLGYCRDPQRAEALAQALPRYGNGPFAPCQGDITTEAGRLALLDATPNIYGLVVFAGDPARGADETALRSSLEANYLGPILLARAAVERMRKAGTPGAVVLFSSMQGGYPFEGSTAYGAAKAALVQAARILAKEAGGSANIRVNVVAPGATMAGMAQASLRSGKYDPFVASGVVPRFGRAEDAALAVRFLLEPDGYVTGQVLTVDGGMTLRRDQRDV